MALVGDFAKLSRAISALSSLASRATFEAIAKSVGQELVVLVDDGFEGERDPAGAAWAKLKGRSGRALQDRGKLRASIHHRVQGDVVLVGTKLFYGTFHQNGTNGREEASSRNQPVSKSGKFQSKTKAAKRKAGSVAFRELKFKAGGGGIPARPFLPEDDSVLPAKWDTRLAAIVVDELERRTRGVG